MTKEELKELKELKDKIEKLEKEKETMSQPCYPHCPCFPCYLETSPTICLSDGSGKPEYPCWFTWGKLSCTRNGRAIRGEGGLNVNQPNQ